MGCVSGVITLVTLFKIFQGKQDKGGIHIEM